MNKKIIIKIAIQIELLYNRFVLNDVHKFEGERL